MSKSYVYGAGFKQENKRFLILEEGKENVIYSDSDFRRCLKKKENLKASLNKNYSLVFNDPELEKELLKRFLVKANFMKEIGNVKHEINIINDIDDRGRVLIQGKMRFGSYSEEKEYYFNVLDIIRAERKHSDRQSPRKSLRKR